MVENMQTFILNMEHWNFQVLNVQFPFHILLLLLLLLLLLYSAQMDCERVA